MSTSVRTSGFVPTFSTKVDMVRPVLPSFADLAPDVVGILSSGMVTKGRHLRAFEEAAAEHLGVDHAVAVSSCTTGLMLIYRALGLTGDVVVPSFTFMATVSAIVWAGLKPVFADVDEATITLDPAAAEAAITSNTSAIVAVHNFGDPADIDELESVARRHGVKLIFDAAHGFGALYHGVPVGRQGDAHSYSLSPTKLVIAGEGGMVATNDAELAERIRIGREYGNGGDYNSIFAGINARMPEFNALMALHSLRALEVAARRRNEVAAIFCSELSSLPGISFQDVRRGNRSSYKDFSLTIDAKEFGITRDTLATGLARHNVDTRKYYDPPVHKHTAYQQFAIGAQLPITDRLAERSLSLPIWSSMDDDTALGICKAVRQVWEDR